MSAVARPVEVSRYALLLRGVNVAGHRRLPMAALRDALADEGFTEISTYVQSGNVVLSAAGSDPGGVARRAETVLAERFHLAGVPVLVRTGEELRRIVDLNPLAELAGDPRRHQVSFLAGEPSPKALATLRDNDFTPEAVRVDGREIYAWHPDGVQGSKLARLLSDERLGTVATARNWRTVTRLLEMIEAK